MRGNDITSMRTRKQGEKYNPRPGIEPDHLPTKHITNALGESLSNEFNFFYLKDGGAMGGIGFGIFGP
jgi:hypothetical protein